MQMSSILLRRRAGPGWEGGGCSVGGAKKQKVWLVHGGCGFSTVGAVFVQWVWLLCVVGVVSIMYAECSFCTVGVVSARWVWFLCSGCGFHMVGVAFARQGRSQQARGRDRAGGVPWRGACPGGGRALTRPRPQASCATSGGCGPGGSARCCRRSTNGRGGRPQPSLASCAPCWPSTPPSAPQPPNACATPGSAPRPTTNEWRRERAGRGGACWSQWGGGGWSLGTTRSVLLVGRAGSAP